MFANIVALLVVIYIATKIVKGGHLNKFFEFIGLVKESTKKQGARGTVHSIVDGLFNNADAVKGAAKNGASKVTSAAKAKAGSLKPQDYEFDATAGELTVFLNKTQDLVLGRHADGRVYAILVNISGTEQELTKKAFERMVAKLVHQKKLSDSQSKAMKDFMGMGRKASAKKQEQVKNQPKQEKRTAFPRNKGEFEAALEDDGFVLDL